jgi:uncharacterized repeat protein (TIGR03803 family)
MLRQRLSSSCSHSISLIVSLIILALAPIAPLAQAQKFTVIHKFTGPPDGGFPGGGVIVDSKGNIYGTTAEGGTGSCDGGCGTVYKFSPSGKETILYSFTGANGDGKYPQGELVRDVAGNLYGTTYGGGTSGTACDGYGCGTVFKLDPDGEETVLYSFSGGVDGATPEEGVVRDSAGNLYGMTKLGGAYDWGTVFAVDASGTETVLHSFDGADGDGGDPVAGLILDSAGMLFGTTQGGGILNSHCIPGLEIGCGTVFQVSTAGAESVLYKFTGYKDGNTPSGNVARDSAGNLYGTSQPQPAPVGYGTIFELDAAGKFTVLHTFTGGAGGVDPRLGRQPVWHDVSGGRRRYHLPNFRWRLRRSVRVQQYRKVQRIAQLYGRSRRRMAVCTVGVGLERKPLRHGEYRRRRRWHVVQDNSVAHYSVALRHTKLPH